MLNGKVRNYVCYVFTSYCLLAVLSTSCLSSSAPRWLTFHTGTLQKYESLLLLLDFCIYSTVLEPFILLWGNKLQIRDASQPLCHILCCQSSCGQRNVLFATDLGETGLSGAATRHSGCEGQGGHGDLLCYGTQSWSCSRVCTSA
jgi:hypothetical protein